MALQAPNSIAVEWILALPLWSANALMNEHDAKILQHIHEAYFRAGADIITTNTFRTHRRASPPAAMSDRALELTRRAVDIARAAMASVKSPSPNFVAGSISTLEDCYRPDFVPSDDELRAEHSERIQHLAECGVDLILSEPLTRFVKPLSLQNLRTITGTPVVVSFVCDREGKMLSGETLTEAAGQLLPLGISAIGVNCGPTPYLAKPLSELQARLRQGFSIDCLRQHRLRRRKRRLG